jgi:hypothetical protein
MSTLLKGSRLSFCLNGQKVELEASAGHTLHAYYGQRDGRRTLFVSSFSDFTREADPAHCWIYDGTGWTSPEASCTDESPAPPTAKPSGDLQSNLDGEYVSTSQGGSVWMGPRWEQSSITTARPSGNFAGLGEPHVSGPVSAHHRTTSAEPEPPSSLPEGSTQKSPARPLE